MLVKIFLTPLLILMCLLVARRWGSFVGGVIAGLPLISGPVSFFLTLEQGAAFSAAASFNTLLGVLACTTTALIYPRLAVWGMPWFVCLPAALCGFFGGGWVVLHLPFDINLGIGAFISAVINFIILAFVLFCMLKAMNKLMDLGKHEEEKPAEPEAPKAPTQEELLTEILAVLKEQQAANGK